uniref:Uncharacterized protein n=1 Tax=Pundamilia nyererei TaxID=303518 RepID=A0A3B4FUI4_9CICH
FIVIASPLVLCGVVPLAVRSLVPVLFPCGFCHLFLNCIIAKESPASLQQEIRGSASCLCSDHEFDMADIFYFCQRGVESIVDDEVTKRFSAQELESWNLLTRSNYNFHHINMRLTLLWGLGLLTRYGILLPLRYDFHWHYEKVHMMGYCMCVSSLTAIITYHNRYSKKQTNKQTSALFKPMAASRCLTGKQL